MHKKKTICPLDCPDACSVIATVDGGLITRLDGDPEHPFTQGFLCKKVRTYHHRVQSDDRILFPQKRVGRKGDGRFERISWDDALDAVADGLLKAEQEHGSEAVWPYFYAGTMGLVMRDGIHRLRHVKRYSGQHSTICVTMAWNGYIAGTGRLAGPDPREMAKSDLVVIWGTNPVNTQINVMTHAILARKERGAKIVTIDTYRTGTAAQADLFLCVKPGTDAALACAVMHVLFRDGKALGPDDLCRRMLPGFFVALGMMLGPEVVEEYQEKLRVVVERVRGDGTTVFNWDDVYKDPTAKTLALNAEVDVAMHFDEFEKRSNWFINMVNGHLTPNEPGAHANLAGWELSETGFKRFLHSLMGDLRAQLDTDSGKMAITKKYGGSTCADLFDIIAHTSQE